jgi:predicted transposase/invertase (TIGR01784 family)
MLATKTPEMKMAVGHLKQLSADERTRMLYEARELYLMDEMARRDAAVAEGEAKGRAEGEAKGEAKAKLETAKKMIERGFDAETIAEVTEMPLGEIKKLN